MGKAHVTEEDLGSNKESDVIPGARAAFYAWLSSFELDHKKRDSSLRSE